MDKKRIWSSAKTIVLKSGHTQEAHYSIDDVQVSFHQMLRNYFHH